MTPNSNYQSLDTYFSQLRDKVESAEQDYPRLASVRMGETTLVDIVNEYENRFYQLLNHKTLLFDKFGIRKLQDDVVKYTAELEQFIEIFDEISTGISSFSSTNSYSYYHPLERYRKQKSDEIEQIMCGSGVIGSFGVMILSALFPFSLGFPLLVIGATGILASPLASPFNPEKNGEYYAESFFKKLKEYAGTIDKETRSAYAVDYFGTNPGLFKETYQGADTSYRNYINRKLTQMQELGTLDMSNIELKSFLDECAEEEEGNDS